MVFRRFFAKLKKFLGGARVARALERHNHAAASLDAAVKEMLKK